MYYALSQHYQPNCDVDRAHSGQAAASGCCRCLKLAASLGNKTRRCRRSRSDDVMHFALYDSTAHAGYRYRHSGRCRVDAGDRGTLWLGFLFCERAERGKLGSAWRWEHSRSHLVRYVPASCGADFGARRFGWAAVRDRRDDRVPVRNFMGFSAVELRVLLPVAIAMVLLSMAIAYAAARPWIKVSPMERGVRHA